MTAKVKAKRPKILKREAPLGQQQNQLDRELDHELADSFPASDPPSVTQPGVKLGAPEHKAWDRK